MEVNERQKWLERIAALVGEDAGETPEIIFEAVAKRIDELEERHATDVEREQSLMFHLGSAEEKLKKIKEIIIRLRNTRSYEQFYIKIVIDELESALGDNDELFKILHESPTEEEIKRRERLKRELGTLREKDLSKRMTI